MFYAKPPIDRMLYNEKAFYDNEVTYTVFAFLNEEIKKKFTLREPPLFYGNADGSGTDNDLSIAIKKAQSEAIERWAFCIECNKNNYGFDIDSTTNGMAAYPNIFINYARKYAQQEAYERYCLIAFWEEKIKIIKQEVTDNYNVVIFENLYKTNLVAVIVYTQIDSFATYGFSCSDSESKAIKKAKVELQRNVEVLKLFYSQQKNKFADLKDIIEKRLVYFSTNEGFTKFLKKIEKCKEIQENSSSPKLIVDSKIDGPWSEYSVVWRCLFQPISIDFSNPDKVDYFWF